MFEGGNKMISSRVSSFNAVSMLGHYIWVASERGSFFRVVRQLAFCGMWGLQSILWVSPTIFGTLRIILIWGSLVLYHPRLRSTNASILTRSILGRVDLHHGPWSPTMEDGFFSWFKSWKNQHTKLLCSFLGVIRMWTKGNDHASIMKCVQKRKFWIEKRNQVWPFSYLHLCSASRPPKNSFKNSITTFLYHGPLALFFRV